MSDGDVLFGRYVLQEQIARGGMGKALDRTLNRVVAINRFAHI
jgi:hypothetical protein